MMGEVYVKGKIDYNHRLIIANLIFTALFFIWGFTPYLRRNIPNLAVLAILMGWLFTAYLYIINRTVKKIPMILIVLSIWFILILFYWAIGYGDTSYGNVLLIILYWFPITIFMFYDSMEEKKYARWLCIGLLILIGINIISSLQIALDNPRIIKYITGRFSDYYERFERTNICDIDFLLSVTLIALSIVWLAKEAISYINRTLLIVLFILIIWLIWESSNMLSFIFLFCAFFLIIISGKRSMKRIITITSILGIFLFLYILRNETANFLMGFADNISNEDLRDRIRDILMSFAGETTTEGSMSERLVDYYISLHTFIRNPIIGKGIIYNIGQINETGIGMHSQILDDVARFGVLTITSYALLYYYYFKLSIERYKKSSYYRTLVSTFLAYIIYSFFNASYFVSTGIIMFFFLPNVPLIIRNKMEVKH